MDGWLKLLCLSLVGLCFACTPDPNDRQRVELTVSAAASLTWAFQELGERFRHETGTRVGLNFGSSGQLAQQIASGAPVDLFAAANMAFLDDLDRQGVLLAETKRPYARGRLTLWTRADSRLRFARLEDVMRPEVRRLALANPSHAPYGVAAREALQAVGLWDQVQSKLVLGENVRQALQYAATGNVDVALVVRSLSVHHEGRWVVLPETLHQPIVQALAVIKQTQHALQARQFAAFIHGPQGQAILRKYGFDGLAQAAGG